MNVMQADAESSLRASQADIGRQSDPRRVSIYLPYITGREEEEGRKGPSRVTLKGRSYH